nr:DNA translocase FtsK [Eubacterium sp.]
MANKKSGSKKKSTTKKNTKSASSKSAAAKKAAETRRKNAEKKRREEENKLRRKKVMGEVQVWIAIVIGIFLFLSNFGICGVVGNFFKDIMLGLFGTMGYVFPIVLIIIVALLSYNKKKNRTVIFRVIGTALLFIDFTIFFHLFTYADTNRTASYFYNLGKNGEVCGGAVGGVLGNASRTGLGMAGAFLVAIALLIVSVVMLTEKSISQYLKARGINAFEKAKEDAKARKEFEDSYEPEEGEDRDSTRRGVNFGATEIQPDKPKRGRKKAEPETQEPTPEEKKPVDIKIEGLDNPKVDDSDFEESDEVIEIKDPEQKKLNQDGVLPEPADDDAVLNGEYEPKPREEMTDDAKAAMERKPFDTDAPTEVGEGEEVSDKQKRLADEGKVIAPTKKVFKYKKPPMTLLNDGEGGGSDVTRAELTQTANKLKDVLADFGVNVEVSSVSKGPAVTRYELQLEQGTRVNKITNLADDIKLAMAAEDIRIEAPIPGKAAVGIEIPNSGRDMVHLKDLLTTPEIKQSKSNLAFPAGKDIAGKVVVGDVAKMPHMLIAGTTGAGKSVFTNSILMSVLFRTTPNDVRVIVIDPKVVEFQVYNGIPHLLYPVVTDPKRAAGILNWAVAEMNNRYTQFADVGTRDIEGYNAKAKAGVTDANGNPLEKMPQILIIIDELADLMMVAAKEVEEAICRLAQLARAAGIHMVIATQRPSVDVITGLIKANVPSRVALTVASGTDSRTIIDMNGAEKLLGLGDMLFYPAGYVKPIRLQGAYVSEKEIKDTVDFIKANSSEAQYEEGIDAKLTSDAEAAAGGSDERDVLFADAGRLCIQKDKGSTSMIQRQFRVGFNRAARIMDQLYDAGVVGQEETNKPRKILMSLED